MARNVINIVGWLLILAVVSSGSLYVLNAIAAHNESVKAHPSIEKLIIANKTAIDLAVQKADSRQLANDEKFKTIDEKQNRMLFLLDNLTLNVNAL